MLIAGTHEHIERLEICLNVRESYTTKYRQIGNFLSSLPNVAHKVRSKCFDICSGHNGNKFIKITEFLNICLCLYCCQSTYSLNIIFHSPQKRRKIHWTIWPSNIDWLFTIIGGCINNDIHLFAASEHHCPCHLQKD